MTNNVSTVDILSDRKARVALLLSLLCLLSGIVYWDFLTFTHLYLYKDIGSDTVNGFYPLYVHLADYMRAEGWPGWSFNRGMGQNIFPHSIGDPFNLLVVMMGSEYIAYGLVYVQVLKVFLAGIIFYLYLRVLSLEPMAAIIGALFYAFSGFMILGGTWYIFSVDAVYFALLLYAFERYLKDRVWVYFALGVALVAAGMSFNLYLYTMFFLPYCLFRYYLCHGWQPKALFRFLLQLTALAVLGIGVSAVFLVANVQEMLNSPRVLGEVSLFNRLMDKPILRFEGFVHNITAVMRLFSSDLLGTGSQFRGWYNYLEAPMFYCGLLTLLLAPQVFVQLNGKKKIAYALFAMIFILPVIMPFFRHLFWAFSGDYYRLFSIFFALVFLFFGMHGLSFILKTGRVHVGVLVVTLVVLLVMLFSPYMLAVGVKVEVVDGDLILLIAALLLVYAMLVLGLKSVKYRQAAQWSLLLVVCVELASFSWQTVNDRSILTAEEMESKAGYNDYSNEAVAAIKKVDSGFYRIGKTYSSGAAMHASLNDAKVQGYFGVDSYHSFNQLNYIRFLDAVDVIGDGESATRWAGGITDSPILASFSAVKYVLVKDSRYVKNLAKYGYQLVHKEGDVLVLQNPYYLPFGFTYDSYLNEELLMSLPTSRKRIALIKTAVVKVVGGDVSSQLVPFDSAGIQSAYSSDAYLGDIRQRHSDVFKINDFSHNFIKGEIALDQPKMLFFTLPFDVGWVASVNGRQVEIQQVNIGFSGILLPVGKHVIELSYHLPYFTGSLIISIVFIVGLLSVLWCGRVKPVMVKEMAE